MPPSRRGSPLEYWGQAEPGSKASSAREALDIADGGANCSTSEQADSGNLAQLLDYRICTREVDELTFDLLDLLLELLNPAEHLRQQRPDRCGQFLRGLREIVGDASTREPRAQGDCNTKLS